jgi:hypothetical protein
MGTLSRAPFEVLSAGQSRNQRLEDFEGATSNRGWGLAGGQGQDAGHQRICRRRSPRTRMRVPERSAPENDSRCRSAP